MKLATTLSVLFLAMLPVGLLAQQPAQGESKPKTKLEAFAAETGVVIVKGFKDIGKVDGRGLVEVECREFTNAKSGERSSGIFITVTEDSLSPLNDSCFIDYDEIASLVAGIDYIGKVNAEATKLSTFEATYNTKGDFSVTVFNEENGRMSVAVKSGRFRRVSAYLNMEKLPELRALILKAKDTLDSLAR